jgi:hypothetical protein
MPGYFIYNAYNMRELYFLNSDLYLWFLIKRKTGEPSDGNCTRMNYRFYNEDNTWESEDCERQLAEYFVCERDIHSGTSISYH